MANDPLKSVLVVGVGSIGHRHVRCFQRTGRVRLSICETNADLRQQIAAQYGIHQAYPDLEAALADRHDAAVITTPAHLHVPMAIRLAEAGSHLLIEKPLGTSLDGLDRLRALVDERSLVAGVAYVLRAHPVLQAMQAAIAAGRIGDPVQAVANCGQHFTTYRPAYREIYYNNRATGGGAIQDAVTHVANALEWMVGPAQRVAADAAHQVLEGVAVEDTVHVMTRHGAVLGCITLNQHQAPNETTITVNGRRGTARYEGHLNRWRWTTAPDEPWHDEPGPSLERDDLFVRQADAFLDAVEGRCPPLCTLAQGIQTLRLNLAMLTSADHGQWRAV